MLKDYHKDALDRYNVTCDFPTVIRELVDPHKRFPFQVYPLGRLFLFYFPPSHRSVTKEPAECVIAPCSHAATVDHTDSCDESHTEHAARCTVHAMCWVVSFGPVRAPWPFTIVPQFVL